ncbi:gamma-glutamyl-gamma-aminobutyrate hydrolase family protein [Nocardia arthritidis]|uniref:gamma-glutamyl-gamma-aminobutyrate hydrolase family protein n=1 Tax=Nocardia arthritidis TaxID=228602 RepID=UPI001EEBF820|nr:gamma-glutamyl-gamma-aminobutyrate hydrolase family protein [Nocardia arthritidis]
MASKDSEQRITPRPVIGLPTYLERAKFGSWDHHSAILQNTYVQTVARSGGIPVLLPPDTVAYPELVERLDGLVLTGGADVDPARYGAPPHPSLGETREDRDASEFELFGLARAAELPILAICRGLQVVNIAMGGTLHQHLPDVLGHDEHSGGPGAYTVTDVLTEPGTRVAAIVGSEVKANCHHHQGIAELADGLLVGARALDGGIEAVEAIDGPFLVGVQWHPESDATDDRLMRALVAAAADYRATRNS